MTTSRPIAFLGGTGKLGRGLALRLAAAGYEVLLGSRAEDRARDAAAELRRRLEEGGDSPARIDGVHNLSAVSGAEIVFLTLPFEILDAFLGECGHCLDGKIVVDVVNPLRFIDGRVELAPVAEGSAAMHILRRAPGARIVSAFKNAAAAHLLRLARPVVGDVFLASDDAPAKAIVARLVRAIPTLRAVDVGTLANAGLVEAITALELNVNRIHRATTTIQLVGLGNESLPAEETGTDRSARLPAGEERAKLQDRELDRPPEPRGEHQPAEPLRTAPRRAR
jgi:8-hydroxy-5-deazaflavin:NADPH oxidoreductase